MSSDGYRVVGVHGPPTKETAPHGYMWRNVKVPESKGEWVGPTTFANITHPETEWWDVPAPPVEQAPAPEPVARWYASKWAGTNWMVSTSQGRSYLTEPEAIAAKNALNTLDRDGVCYGPGRPISELPVTGRVLVLRKMGGFEVWDVDHFRDLGIVVCWWPLPESGE